MGHKHTKEEILAGALELSFAEGIGRLTFGRVAKHLGVSDRIVVYYFPNKDDLIGEVLMAIGLRLQGTLAPAFSEPAADYTEMAKRAWPILASDKADPVFALFFESAGLAASGVEPYRSLVPELVEAWIAWAAELVEGPRSRRRAEAEAAIALLDGLLLMRHIVGPLVAQRAAKRLGLR